MTVDQAIEMLRRDSALAPLVATLEMGRGLPLQTFCENLEFSIRPKNGKELAALLTKVWEATQNSGKIPTWSASLLQSKGPLLNAAIKELGSIKGSNLSETRKRLQRYIETGELPSPPPKKAARKKSPKKAAAPKMTFEEAMTEYRKLAEIAKTQSVTELESRFKQKLGKLTGPTITKILAEEGYTTAGKVGELRQRLLNPFAGNLRGCI